MEWLRSPAARTALLLVEAVFIAVVIGAAAVKHEPAVLYALFALFINFGLIRRQKGR